MLSYLTAVKRRLHGITNLEMLPLAAVGLVSGGAFAFFRIASQVADGKTWDFDEAILLALRQPGDPGAPIGPWWVRNLVTDITSLGGTTVLTLITVLTTVYLLLTARRGIAGLLLASVLGGWLLSATLKLGIARPRPDIVDHLVRVSDFSFPSGHAMLSTVTYMTLGVLLARTQQSRVLRFYFIGIAILLSIAIGLSRIYLGVHYPTDVLGGWCAGAAWAIACWFAARRFLAT